MNLLKHTAFQIGDRVVLSPYGIGVVCGTCERPVAGQAHTYYEVKFPATVSRAYVPVADPASTGIRRALGDQDLHDLMNHLQNGELELPRQWSARHRLVNDILAGGKPYELAALTCQLRRWNVQRGLPDLDRQAFRRAIRLLEQEVSDLRNQLARQVEDYLQEVWNEQPHVQLPAPLAAASV
ncbi:transcriptional regulator [Deinococcus malanensis]|uniref:Transcriptional regulator n=1 Tax=Deinococcus malanensis TaxID=1706855 RepID=A0ABQ2EYG6_9DEIO|nr:transcriptional regulator [Deinococcus malanensis]